ncbi:hypothetical protein V3H18_04000 [Methylocystis sp. 9N]|uniref:Type II toxin-antitoxin system RelE/ParE family toxin n=1 Tax=Methylocystis borbori TaxID=3118750 RepID=A0ABU7XF60_9HYPH
MNYRVVIAARAQRNIDAYRIDEESRMVRVLRMWNAARNPQDFRA